MDRRLSLLLFGAFAIMSIFAAWAISRVTTGGMFTGLPIALALGGPAALVLLTPHALIDPRPWARLAGRAVLPLSVSLVFGEAQIAFTTAPDSWIFAQRAAFLGLFGGITLLLVWRARATASYSWPSLLLWTGAACLATFFAPLMTTTIVLFFASELACVAAVAGFSRSASDWVRAAGAFFGCALASLLILFLALGQLAPPRLVLDDHLTMLVALPLLGVCGLVGLLVLMLSGRSTNSSARYS